MASSVVRVHRGHDRGQESEDLEEDEDEEEYGLPSKVSLPAKPERKCVLLETKSLRRFMALMETLSNADRSLCSSTGLRFHRPNKPTKISSLKPSRKLRIPSTRLPHIQVSQ